MISKKTTYGLIESVIFNVIVFLIFFQFSSLKQDFIYMNLHPLLIVTAIIAVRYGNYVGIFCATFSSLVFIYSYSLLGRDIFLFFVIFEHYKFLLMFYLTAVVLGKFRDNHDFEIYKLNTKLDELKNRNKDLKKSYDEAIFVKDELKKQIVGAEHSILSLYDIATNLNSLDPEEVYSQTMGILKKFLKAKAVSIYTVDKEHKYLRLKLKMGNIIETNNSIQIKSSKWYKSMIEDKEIKVVTDYNEDDVPIFSAPIVKDNEPIAIINIEDMDFEMVTDYSYHLFKMIIDWINKSLVKALIIEEEINKSKYYKETKMMSIEDFDKRVKNEEKRKKELGLNYEILSYSLNHIDIYEFDKTISNLIRFVDLVGYDDNKNIAHILLPATPKEALAVVDEKIQKGFGYKLERIK